MLCAAGVELKTLLPFVINRGTNAFYKLICFLVLNKRHLINPIPFGLRSHLALVVGMVCPKLCSVKRLGYGSVATWSG